MELRGLLVRLPEKAGEYIVCADESAAVNSIRLMTRGQTEFRPDTLYFGDLGLLPKALRSDQFLCYVGFGGYALPPYYAEHDNSDILVLRPDVDPFECFNDLQAFFVEEQELTDKIRRMLMALLSNNGLQYLIDEAGETLGNPIFVIDNSYRYIARHIGKLPADDSEYARIMSQEMEYDSILESGVAYIREHKLDEKLCRQDRPYCHYHEYLKKTTMIATVRIRGVEMAHVMMVEQNHPFGKYDEECFARLTLFVGQELQKSPLYQKNRGQMYSYFLINLLEDSQPSRAVIQRRLRVLHYRLLDKFYVVVLQPKDGGFTGQSVDAVIDRLRDILTGNIYALYESQLVVLFNRKKNEYLGEYTEEVLRQFAATNMLNVGVSNAFDDLTDIHRYYEQAVNASKYGERFSKAENGGSLFYYREYAYMEMLDLCSRQTNLMNYCDPHLLDLIAYDEQKNSDLTATFYAYLLHSANTQRTADALCMHKNTLLYRIDRIKEIIGNDLSSGEDLFMFHLSFRVLIFLGIFHPKHLQSRIEKA